MARMQRLLATVMAVGLIAAACSSSSSDSTAASADSDTTAATSGSDSTAASDDAASGSIIISGSSTVEPISALNAEAFRALQPEVGVSVEGPGTGDGFKKFCAGETDISDASRAIKDSEKEACAAAGIDFIELQVAIDGLSVVTSNANVDIACLSFNDLYALLGPESTGFGNWSDANDLASELESTSPPYPDADLTVTAPGPESGTYDTFVEFTIEDLAEERGQETAPRLDYTASANDNVIIEGIAGSDTSLGWVGYAFYLGAQDRVKAVGVDGNDGTCVEPTIATIADGSYPLSRPLFIYVDPAKAEPGTALAGYVDFYLSEEGLAAVDQAGYVRLSDYDTVRTRWENRETGSVVSP